MGVITHSRTALRQTTIGRMTTHLAGDAIVRHPGQPAATPEGVNGYPPGAALMTAAGLESLRSELGRLRERTGLEVAHRLREARPYGEGANNDEYHAVREEQMVLQARMASLEATIARAIVVDSGDAAQGVAAIGSTRLGRGSRLRRPPRHTGWQARISRSDRT